MFFFSPYFLLVCVAYWRVRASAAQPCTHAQKRQLNDWSSEQNTYRLAEPLCSTSAPFLLRAFVRIICQTSKAATFHIFAGCAAHMRQLWRRICIVVTSQLEHLWLPPDVCIFCFVFLSKTRISHLAGYLPVLFLVQLLETVPWVSTVQLFQKHCSLN